jgi:HAD domain in Swiss Army Knife RNA repair proteins
MKVIFLDIDGVLINRECLRTMESDYVPADRSIQLLNALIQQTDAKIVVSSCWRKRRTCAELQELLSGWGVEGVVLDKTPTFPEDARGLEIQQWLAERKKSRGDVESFVILDDCSDMPTLLEFLVQTEFETGLTRRHTEKAVQILMKTGCLESQRG